MRSRTLAGLLGLLLLLCAARPARAHRPGLSVVRVGRAEIALSIAAPDLAPLGSPEEAAVPLSAGWLVEGEAGRCTLGDRPTVAPEGAGFTFTWPLDCGPGGPRSLRAGWLEFLEPGHRAALEVDGAQLTLLDREHPAARFDAPAGAWEVGRRYASLGVEHIWTGWDHLAFVLALVVAASGPLQVLGVVTGFTLGHSVTLSLAALGVVTPSPRVVEPAIAATILYTGLENLARPPARRRALLTTFLGLVHGFGFAGALRELGLPQGRVPLALASFNLGVEAGQAAVVVALLPLLAALRRWGGWRRAGMPAVSLVVAALGGWWLVERLAAL